MNHLLDSDLDRDQVASHGDREISLGPGTLLGLFFVLAILCGAFFGLGYSMGRHSAQDAPSAIIMPNGSATVSSGTKPTAGSSATVKTTAQLPDSIPDSPPAQRVQSKATAADGAIVGDRISVKTPAATPAPTVTPAASAAAAALPAIAPNGTFMVQVAAVSSKDIADIELAALKKYNYPVIVRHEPQDQLLHIQIGPFATKKDAEAMRQNVLSHGFNAIVK
jgi:DedD protein